jgi:hypothetical protein
VHKNNDVNLHKMRQKCLGDGKRFFVLHCQERREQVQVVRAEDGGRVAAVAVGQGRDRVVVEEILFAGDGHVGRSDTFHFVLRVRHHLALAQHPVHLVLLAEQTKRLKGKKKFKIDITKLPSKSCECKRVI